MVLKPKNITAQLMIVCACRKCYRQWHKLYNFSGYKIHRNIPTRQVWNDKPRN